MPDTPARNLRVSETLWKAARAKCRRLNDRAPLNVSTVIVERFREFVDEAPAESAARIARAARETDDPMQQSVRVDKTLWDAVQDKCDRIRGELPGVAVTGTLVAVRRLEEFIDESDADSLRRLARVGNAPEERP